MQEPEIKSTLFTKVYSIYIVMQKNGKWYQMSVGQKSHVTYCKLQPL